MTCIVAIIKDGDIYMGADSAATDDSGTIQRRKDAKIFKNGNFIIGCCGSLRMAELLRFSFAPPRQTIKDVYRYMCTIFINAVRKCLIHGGLTKIHSNVEEIEDSSFIVGYRGRIFIIDEDFQVGELHHHYASIGSGEDIAYGSLFTSSDLESPEERIMFALCAAEEFNNTVRKPFVLEVLEGEK